VVADHFVEDLESQIHAIHEMVRDNIPPKKLVEEFKTRFLPLQGKDFTGLSLERQADLGMLVQLAAGIESANQPLLDSFFADEDQPYRVEGETPSGMAIEVAKAVLEARKAE
ncbi:MAG: hypothetical protein AAF497_09750, partial [Planctomycetota bacterium]